MFIGEQGKAVGCEFEPKECEDVRWDVMCTVVKSSMMSLCVM